MSSCAAAIGEHNDRNGSISARAVRAAPVSITGGSTVGVGRDLHNRFPELPVDGGCDGFRSPNRRTPDVGQSTLPLAGEHIYRYQRGLRLRTRRADEHGSCTNAFHALAVACERAAACQRIQLRAQASGIGDCTRGHAIKRSGQYLVSYRKGRMRKQQPLRRPDVQRQPRADARRYARVTLGYRYRYRERLESFADNQLDGLPQFPSEHVHDRSRKFDEIAFRLARASDATERRAEHVAR